MDLMGDLGGVMEVLIFIFGIFLFPVTEFSFNLDAISSIFKVKSAQWKSNCEANNAENDKDGASAYDFDKQRISLSGTQIFKLFFLNQFQSLICDCCHPKSTKIENQKLVKLYQRGIDRLDEELSIDYILKILA